MYAHLFFFFQAEDGIRDVAVTGVQTCALPIWTRGIYALDRQNITIKNGTVRGFYRGILLHDSGGDASQGHVVEDIRADQNTFIGIQVNGRSSLIRNNQVVATGGTTFFGGNADAYGIAI